MKLELAVIYSLALPQYAAKQAPCFHITATASPGLQKGGRHVCFSPLHIMKVGTLWKRTVHIKNVAGPKGLIPERPCAYPLDTASTLR